MLFTYFRHTKKSIITIIVFVSCYLFAESLDFPVDLDLLFDLSIHFLLYFNFKLSVIHLDFVDLQINFLDVFVSMQAK